MCEYNKSFSLDDFDHEQLQGYERYLLENLIRRLNYNRDQFIATGDKFYYHNIEALIPRSYRGGKA